MTLTVKHDGQPANPDTGMIPRKPTSQSRILRWIARLSIIVFVVFAAWVYIDFERLLQSILSTDRSLVPLLLVISFIDRLWMAVKWHQLLRTAGVDSSLISVVKAYCQAALVLLAVPSSLGGDILRGYTISRETGSTQAVLGSMVVEKAIGVLASVCLATVSVTLFAEDLNRQGLTWRLLLIPAISLVSVAVFIFSFTTTFGHLIEKFLPTSALRTLAAKFLSSYSLYKARRTALVLNFFLAVGEQFLQILLLYTCAVAIGLQVGAKTIILALMLTQFLKKLAIVIEGWVLGQFITVLTCSLVGIDQTQALAFSLLGHAVWIAVCLPAGILLMLSPLRTGHSNTLPDTDKEDRDDASRTPS